MNKDDLEKLILKNNESEIIEFKTNFNDVTQICKYISALANSAIMSSVTYAYMIWGVKDITKEIIGTKFDPYTTKARINPRNEHKKKAGNIPFITYIEQYINPKINLQWIDNIKIEGKRIVCLIIDVSNATEPIMFKKDAYIRSGTSVKLLADYPEKARRIWNSFNSSKFELEFAKTDLTFDQIKKLLDIKFYMNNINETLTDKPSLINSLKVNNIIVSVGKGKTFNITNLGAYTLAKDLSNFPNLNQRTPRITKYDGNKKTDNAIFDRKGKIGIIVSFNNMVKVIMSFLPNREDYSEGIRKEIPQFPLIAVRELLANALAHQDFTILGMRSMVEIFDNKLVISNPGVPLIDTLRFLDHPPISRNTELANLLEKFNIVELRGTGIDKVVNSLEEEGLPAVEIVRKGLEATQVTLRPKKKFDELSTTEINEKIYWSACLSYVNDKQINNASVRKIFGLNKNKSGKISTALNRAVDAHLIKPYDIKAGRKLMTYIPFWGQSVQANSELDSRLNP